MLLERRNGTQGDDGMNDERRRRKRVLPLITIDTLTLIVYASLLFCAGIIVWGMIQASHGIDSSAIVDSALRVFGTELGICGALTIYKRWVELQDRRAEERRKRRQEGMKNNERNSENYNPESVNS